MFFFPEHIRPTRSVPVLWAVHSNSIVPTATAAASVATAGPSVTTRMTDDPNVRMVVATPGPIWLSCLASDAQQLASNSLSVVLGFSLMTLAIGCELTTTRNLKGVIVAKMGADLLVAPLFFVIWNLRANQTLARELKARASPTHVADVRLHSLGAAVIASASARTLLKALKALYDPHIYLLGRPAVGIP